MDWKLFASTFAAIFVAELGDKTQLAALSLSAGSSGAGPDGIVFAGSSLALIATSAIAVAAGEAVSRVVPPIWIRRAAGAIFVVMGLVFLLGRRRRPSDPTPALKRRDTTPIRHARVAIVGGSSVSPLVAPLQRDEPLQAAAP